MEVKDLLEHTLAILLVVLFNQSVQVLSNRLLDDMITQ